MRKRKKSPDVQPKWMRDKDFARTILLLIFLIAGLYLLSIDILFQVNPKGFAYLLYPFVYLFSLYQRASPGEQLSAIFLLIGGLGGWFLKRWTEKRQ